MPVLGDPTHKDIISSLKNRVPQILRLNTPEAPRAIIVVTAHWSERVPTISNGERHKLYYDYGGFPPESYKLKYAAPGSPAVAKEIYDALKEAGLKPDNDEERGMHSSSLKTSSFTSNLHSLLTQTNHRLGPRRLRPPPPYQPKSRHSHNPTLSPLL
jgi:hypothetical protein